MTDFLEKMVVIDVETTGLSPSYDRIVEVGIAVFEGTRWTHRADFFVNPEGRVLKQEVIDLHGIRPEQVMNAPPFYEVFNKIAPWLYGATPVGYGGDFDRRFISQAIVRSWPRHAFAQLPPALLLDARWVDVCALCRWCVPELPGGKYKLARVAEHLGFDTKEAHRADYDAMLTGSILLKLIGDNPTFDWRYAATIERQRRAAAEFARKKFFWQKPDKDDPNHAWLGKGKDVQVFECDLCHAMAPGRYQKTGWMKPEYWQYCGPAGRERVVCSDTCESVASWHMGW